MLMAFSLHALAVIVTDAAGLAEGHAAGYTRGGTETAPGQTIVFYHAQNTIGRNYTLLNLDLSNILKPITVA